MASPKTEGGHQATEDTSFALNDVELARQLKTFAAQNEVAVIAASEAKKRLAAIGVNREVHDTCLAAAKTGQAKICDLVSELQAELSRVYDSSHISPPTDDDPQIIHDVRQSRKNLKRSLADANNVIKAAVQLAETQSKDATTAFDDQSVLVDEADRRALDAITQLKTQLQRMQDLKARETTAAAPIASSSTQHDAKDADITQDSETLGHPERLDLCTFTSASSHPRMVASASALKFDQPLSTASPDMTSQPSDPRKSSASLPRTRNAFYPKEAWIPAEPSLKELRRLWRYDGRAVKHKYANAFIHPENESYDLGTVFMDFPAKDVLGLAASLPIPAFYVTQLRRAHQKDVPAILKATIIILAAHITSKLPTEAAKTAGQSIIECFRRCDYLRALNLWKRHRNLAFAAAAAFRHISIFFEDEFRIIRQIVKEQ